MSSGFITEAEIEEKRRLRQTEWEKVRKPDDPAVAPDEPPPDNRSLFDRLQEQKMKKQEEFDEAHKLSLDDDEADFLEYVDKAKMDLERQKRMEEVKELSEFRSKMAELREQELDLHIKHELGLVKTEKKVVKPYDDELPSIGTRKTTQSKLLAGVIKRKAPPSNPEDELSKKITKSNDEEQPQGSSSTVIAGPTTSETAVDSDYVVHSVPYKGSLVCIGILPGLASYSDSSNSEDENSSDSEQGDCVPRDLCGRQIIQTEEDESDGNKKKK